MTKQKDQFSLPLSRRDFHKLTLGAGAAMALGSLLPGCGSSHSPESPPVNPEVKTLHFDLSLPVVGVHTLYVAGRRYKLAKHTPDTLRHLASPAKQPTHYVEGASFSGSKPHTFQIVTNHPERGHGLLMTGLHVPAEARAIARQNGVTSYQSSLAAQAATCDPAIENCDVQDQIADDFLSTLDTAKTIIFHHPEIASLDSDTAARIELHMGNSAAILNLASKIWERGAAYEHNPNYPDGWCVLVLMRNEDGSLVRGEIGHEQYDDNGDLITTSDGSPLLNYNIYDYQFNELLNPYINAALKEILSFIKNDPDLDGKMYTSYPVGSTSDNSLAAKANERFYLWKASGQQLTATATGYHHNVWFKSPRLLSPRQFELDLFNMNFICYGLYVQCFDANGQVVQNFNSGEMLKPGTQIEWALGLESPTIKWESFVLSPPVIFGIPIPTSSPYVITLPDGAVSAKVMLCGPGVGGNVELGGSLVVGAILTAVLNFAIPMYFLYAETGVSETSTLKEVITPGVVLSLLPLGYNIYEQINDPNHANSLSMTSSFESTIAVLADSVVQMLIRKEIPALASWLMKTLTKNELEEAAPFAGWALRLIAVSGTIADLAMTTAEILSNPRVIENTITFTNTVDITVNHDPTDYQFPEGANYYEVQFTIGGYKYPAVSPIGFALDPSLRANDSIKVSIDGIPTTARYEAVEIWFYDSTAKKFLAAYGKSTFKNVAANTSDNIPAAITIIENPMKISADTIYSQKRKLAYSNGNYIWQADLTAPAVTPVNCSTGLCSLTNISVWVPGGMIGYTWQTGNQYHIKNINARENDPNPGMKSLFPSGAGAPTPVFYDAHAPSTDSHGNHFYLDSVIDQPEYHLRKLNLDSSSSEFKTSGSWGRFTIPLDRIAMHPDGYVVGISTVCSKMAVLEVPKSIDTEAFGRDAMLKLGEGKGDKLIKSPVALTISRTGAILILQGQSDSMSIRAFDTSGNPWPYFGSGEKLSSTLNLTDVDPDATWLDISIDDTELIFILSHTGTGGDTNDYHLDIYQKDGTRIIRNTGISVQRMVVDKFRKLYSLNHELIMGSDIVEPSVSVWMPNFS